MGLEGLEVLRNVLVDLIVEKRRVKRDDLERLFSRAVEAAAPFERPLVRSMLAQLRQELELEPDDENPVAEDKASA